jgi:hypothetical protein
MLVVVVTPLIALVKVLVLVEKEEVLDEITDEVATTPLTVEVKVLPVTD